MPFRSLFLPLRSALPPRPPFRRLRAAPAAVAAACCGLLVLPSSAGAADAPGAAGAHAPRIHDIQGRTRLSPFAGREVTGVPGIVTGVRDFGAARGFWLQDPHPDRDRATSEGIYVHTGGDSPGVEVGDALRITGTVQEYYPGGKEAGNQSITELSGATWRTTGHRSRGRLPRAVRLTARSVPEAYAPDADGGPPGSGGSGGGSIENRPLRPGRYALDRYESLEGMRVSVHDVRVTGPTSRYHDLWVTIDPDQHPTPRGGTLYGSYEDRNGARMKISSLLPLDTHPFPKADVGDALSGTTEGPLDYEQYGGYTLRATKLGEHRDNHLKRERTRKQRRSELAVATYNVENLSPASEPAKFERLAEGLVTNLSSPDIVTVEEVQDDSGPQDDGTVGAGRTLTKLTEAIREAGGPSYAWRQIDPEDKADGGQPGGNIRVAFLYNPARVSFTDRPGGDATTPVRVLDRGGEPALSASPGRIAPRDTAWEDSRKPLAGEFRFRGRTVFVIADHFSSKGGDQPMEGRFQPPARHSEQQRVAQAEVVNGFVRTLQDVDPEAVVVAGGDFNDFPFSPTLRTLRSGHALTSPLDRLPRDERYGYVYNGNSQTLDHLLTSPGAGRTEYDIVHINAEFADQISDHDPSVVRITRR